MLAQHIAVDLYGVDPDLLRDSKALAPLMCEAIRYSGGPMPVVQQQGCVLTDAVRLCWRAWPQHGLICIDVFITDATAKPTNIIDTLTEKLEPNYADHHETERGRFVAVEPNRSPEPEDAPPRPRLICIDGDAQ